MTTFEPNFVGRHCTKEAILERGIIETKNIKGDKFNS